MSVSPAARIPNPLETRIGPLSIEVVEGLRRHRLTLDRNDSPLSFDIEFLATMNPHEKIITSADVAAESLKTWPVPSSLGRYRGWIQLG